jgi:hypothetical protein
MILHSHLDVLDVTLQCTPWNWHEKLQRTSECAYSHPKGNRYIEDFYRSQEKRDQVGLEGDRPDVMGITGKENPGPRWDAVRDG